jgi:hypothetical protein
MGEGPFLPSGRSRRFFGPPGRRVLFLWVALVLMFLVIWQVLQPSNGGTVPAPPPQQDDDFWTATLLRSGPLAAAFALTVGFVFWASRRTRGFNAANAQGLRALAEGEPARAAEAFELVAKQYRWPASLRRIASFNLAIAQLHQGRLSEAIDRFAAVDREANWTFLGLRTSLACHVALAYALRGEIDSARTWRAEADKQLKHATDQAGMTGLLAYVDAVIDVREGRHESFVRWLDERWRQLEGSLTARTTRPLRVLRAYALAHGEVRDAAAADKALEALRPARPGEFAMLEASWPEMKAFLSTAL